MTNFNILVRSIGLLIPSYLGNILSAAVLIQILRSIFLRKPTHLSALVSATCAILLIFNFLPVLINPNSSVLYSEIKNLFNLVIFAFLPPYILYVSTGKFRSISYSKVFALCFCTYSVFGVSIALITSGTLLRFPDTINILFPLRTLISPYYGSICFLILSFLDSSQARLRFLMKLCILIWKWASDNHAYY